MPLGELLHVRSSDTARVIHQDEKMHNCFEHFVHLAEKMSTWLFARKYLYSTSPGHQADLPFFLIWRWFWYRKMNLSLILFMLCVEKTRLMYKSTFYFSHKREKERMNSRHPNHLNIWPCFWNYFETRQSKRGSWLIGLHVPITQTVPTCGMQSTYQYTPTLKPHWKP